MATNVINGTDLYMFSGGTPIAHSTGHTLTITRATRGKSTKDSGTYVTRGKGRLTITASCSALMVYGSFEAIIEAQAARTAVTLAFAKKTVGGAVDTTESYATGTFFITSIDQNAPDGENATYTANFECDGTFTFTKV